MQNDYISREAAIKRLKANKKWAICPLTMDYAAKLISTLPAADVRPVVYAEEVLDADGIYIVCSRCGGHNVRNFCPNCGAEMRGGSAKC